MTLPTQNFTTGPSVLPDVGDLSYNGCTFSPLYTTKLSGTVVKDDAMRTTKLMEYVLLVDGYVTLTTGNTDIAPTMATLRRLLTAQGGILSYKGRGFDLVVNGPGANVGVAGNQSTSDVAWGPIPELLEFQPLGGGLSAKIVWKVTTRVAEIKPGLTRRHLQVARTPLLQFNVDTSVEYGEDYYSTLSVSGTMEIPLTRSTQDNRTLTSTVDNARNELDIRVFAGIDLTRFRISQRTYRVSRDKRTMQFEVTAEEKPYMDLPPDCPIARGSYSVKPSKSGQGMVSWLCTLKCSYIVSRDRRRRTAWFRFLDLLRLRMNASTAAPNVAQPQNAVEQAVLEVFNIPNQANQELAQIRAGRRAWLVDFSIDEGIYLDSKTTSFSATWRLISRFEGILIASGLWRKLPETDVNGNNLWATSMRNISGSESWLPNRIDPALDVIVDFGGG